MIDNSFLKSGKLELGSNFLASHAGTNMWKDWRQDVVEADIAILAEYGVTIMRVFPLWPDFQPITVIKGAANRVQEYRFGDQPLPDNDAGKAGVSIEACEHFEILCQIAAKHGIKLIVALLSGWMSGRTHTPQALDGMNLFTDPVALMWEIRFINYFVNRMKSKTAIAAWDLGNECNCMSTAETRETAWTWSATITSAINAQDGSRPVVSGMHSLLPEGTWTIQDQAEITDILTTHPYPAFTPYCDLDPVNTPRGILHSSAESRMYADIGCSPCIVEEIGTLGPMNGNADTVREFFSPALFSMWADDCQAMLWWSNADFNNLIHPPYDYYMIERELGIFDENRNPKQAALTIKAMGEFFATLPFDVLPPRIIDAVCILTHDQDCWANAFGSFVLGKQSGVDIEFQYADQPIKDSSVYMMPGITGQYIMPRRRWIELLSKVKEGATLYISMDDGTLTEFEEVTGLQVISRCNRPTDTTLRVLSAASHPKGTLSRSNRLKCTAVNADVLGTDSESLPAFTRAQYGKGTVYVLLAPMEKYLATTSGAFQDQDVELWSSIYRMVVGKSNKVLKNLDTNIGVTEHELSLQERIIVAVNYTPGGIDWKYDLAEGWKLKTTYRGLPAVAGSDAAVFAIEKMQD